MTSTDKVRFWAAVDFTAQTGYPPEGAWCGTQMIDHLVANSILIEPSNPGAEWTVDLKAAYDLMSENE